jgi:SAM-dependent methyltransferase
MLAAADEHWWYRGRRRIVRAQLAGLHLPRDAQLLDAGCGSGQLLSLLSEFGLPTGVDPDPESVACAAARGYDVAEAGLPDLPFADASFDACTCLDVLEHLYDDAAALAELARVTARHGYVVVTVPAYEALWSAHDEANEHLRRYRARDLRALAGRAGLSTERVTYFNTLLLPPAAVVRIAERLRRHPRPATTSDLDLTPRSLNRALEVPLRIEAAVLRRGARLPAGLSLLAVLRRRG